MKNVLLGLLFVAVSLLGQNLTTCFNMLLDSLRNKNYDLSNLNKDNTLTYPLNGYNYFISTAVAKDIDRLASDIKIIHEGTDSSWVGSPFVKRRYRCGVACYDELFTNSIKNMLTRKEFDMFTKKIVIYALTKRILNAKCIIKNKIQPLMDSEK